MSRSIEAQRQIWTNMYGPQKAEELLHRAQELQHQQPDRSLESIARELDPDDDFDDGAASRPGVG